MNGSGVYNNSQTALGNVRFGFGILSLILAGPTIMGNALIITAIIKTTSLRTPGYILLSGLAISDFGVGINAFLVQGIARLSNNSWWSVAYSSAMVTFFVGGSLVTLLAVSGDRVLALTFHLRYVTMVTNIRAVLLLVFIWATAAVYPVLSSISASITVVIIITVNFALNCKIYLVVRRHQNLISIQGQAGDAISVMRRRKSSLNVIYIFAVFLGCTLPWVLCTIVEVYWIISNCSLQLLYLNSLFSPILYCYRIRDIRKAVLKLIKCKD
ncbi:G-protein coupled receptor 12 [Nematostella vectensis]|uniref:G-protein coupled receptor 12 n=1 Tax=Nematostella vectensis TaxID=45351 RepID=UPI0013905296|nr:G-protein coupled receptor 12 [Nematostella vectensis]